MVGTLLAGFAVGWSLSPRERGGAEVGRVGLETGGGEPGPATSSTPRDRPPTEVAPRPVSRSSVAGLLEAAFLSGDVDYAAVKPLMRALSALSAESLPEFIAFFRSRPLEREQLFLWQMFLAAWGEFDAPAAIAFIEARFEDLATRRLLYASVMDTWKNESIEGALEVALEKFQAAGGTFQTHLALDYLRSLAESDPDQALEFSRGIGDGELVLELTARRIAELAKKDRQLALDAIATLEGEAHYDAATRFMAEWAKGEPAAAAGWIADNIDQGWELGTFVSVAAEYLSADPGAAIGWIDALPGDRPRGEILSAALEAWVRADPGSAAAWLARSGVREEHDAGLIALSHQLSAENPRDVLEEWVPKISDPGKGNEVLYEVSLGWQRSNSAEFSRWLEGTESISPEAKRRLLSREFPGEGGRDPAAATPAAELDQGRFDVEVEP